MIAHPLIVADIVVLVALALFRYRHPLFGVPSDAGVLKATSSWTRGKTPRDGLFPVFGWFRVLGVLDDTDLCLWLDLSNPAEWIFVGSSILLLIGYAGLPRQVRAPGVPVDPVRACPGPLRSQTSSWPTPDSPESEGPSSPGYSALTTFMAGILALAGAGVLVRYPSVFFAGVS